MKKSLFFIFMLVNMFVIYSCSAQDKSMSDSKNSETIEVFYFHFTHRCMTCNTVEAESKKAIETLYPEQIKSGKVVFKALNLDEDSSKTDAQRCNAAGQSLLIVCGDKKNDLTSTGFMNAVSNPEKLKAEIKKTIDSML